MGGEILVAPTAGGFPPDSLDPEVVERSAKARFKDRFGAAVFLGFLVIMAFVLINASLSNR